MKLHPLIEEREREKKKKTVAEIIVTAFTSLVSSRRKVPESRATMRKQVKYTTVRALVCCRAKNNDFEESKVVFDASVL